MFAYQSHIVEVVMLDNGLIALGDVNSRGQKAEVAMLQYVLFLRRKIAAFSFAHAQSLKKLRENVPQKVLTPLSRGGTFAEGPRPSRNRSSRSREDKLCS